MNCCFPCPLDPFRTTNNRNRVIGSLNTTYYTPLYENKHNVREIVQWRLLTLMILLKRHYKKLTPFIYDTSTKVADSKTNKQNATS